MTQGLADASWRTTDADVIVVGTGAGGAVMAAELAEGGRGVILVEEGSHYRTGDFTTHATDMIVKLYRDGGASQIFGHPPIRLVEGRCVGGSTTINGGMCYRTPERVLARWADDQGLPEIRAQALDRHYRKVEGAIHVNTQDPHTLGRDHLLLVKGAEALGWRYIDNTRNQWHCAGSNNCAFGCPTGAKRSTLLSYVPRALAAGARLLPDTRAVRVLRRGRKVFGLRAWRTGPDGRREKLELRAPRVVVAGGSLQTPALLQRSGIRDPGRWLGRNLSVHPHAKVAGVFDEPVRGWEGTHQGHQVREFLEEGINIATGNVPPGILAMTLQRSGPALAELMAAYDRIVVAGCMAHDLGGGRVRSIAGRPFAFYDLHPEDIQRLIRAVGLTARILFAAGARRVLLPFACLPELTAADQLEQISRYPIPRGALEVLSVHIMGTCRMAADARRGAVDPWGAFHGLEGLFVSDASIFPGPIGLNPMLTIMALATRNAEHMLEGWKAPT